MQIALTSLVYEKQQNLRIMMKMHGLGDGPYWMISYGYFLAISIVYMLCFVIFGSVIGKNTTSVLCNCFLSLIFSISQYNCFFFSGLNFFTMNDYSIQFVFYFIYINLQISLAFLLASLFSNVKTATGLMIVIKLLYQYFLLSDLITFFFSRFLFLYNCSTCIHRSVWNWAICYLSFPIFCSRHIISM